MFCKSCNVMKAGAGCYAPGADERVCLECYIENVGSFPLPVNTPPALGGAFADAKKIRKNFAKNVAGIANAVAGAAQSAAETVGKATEEASRIIASEAGGFRQDLGDIKKTIREEKEAFWKQMPEDVQSYRNKLNKSAKKIVDGEKEIINDTVDFAKKQVNSAIDKIADFF